LLKRTKLAFHWLNNALISEVAPTKQVSVGISTGKTHGKLQTLPLLLIQYFPLPSTPFRRTLEMRMKLYEAAKRHQQQQH